MILVTGATGNVGQHLIPLLLAKDASVRILVRDKSKVARLADSAECVVGNLDQPETLRPAMQGVDQLYIVTPDTQQVTQLLAAELGKTPGEVGAYRIRAPLKPVPLGALAAMADPLQDDTP